MRNLFLFVFLLASLSACDSVLRQPSLSLDKTEFEGEAVEFQVKGIEISPNVVERANSSEFTRLVLIGGDSSSPARAIGEKDLFKGRKLPFNQKPALKLGVGDIIVIRRSGFQTIERGVDVRQIVEREHQIDENGNVTLDEGINVQLEGLTVAIAQSALQEAFSELPLVNETGRRIVEFPITSPGIYRIGVGDVLKVSRVINSADSNDNILESVSTTSHMVGQDGIISILTLGDFEVAGLPLTQVRERVVQQSIRNASGANAVLDIELFGSQSAVVSGALGSLVVKLTNKPETFSELLARLNPDLSGNQDYFVTLERDGAIYRETARQILSDDSRRGKFLMDGDAIQVSLAPATPLVTLDLAQVQSQEVTFVRAKNTANGAANSVRMKILQNGLDLRNLLVDQRVEVSLDHDALVEVSRDGRLYRHSAQSILFESPNKRFWLSPGDHVVVKDIPYVADLALLVGEFSAPKQLPINRLSRTKLAEALFGGGAFSDSDADFRNIYVIRGQGTQFEAFHFDVSSVLNLDLAKKFELRPSDIVFVNTRPLSETNRALTLVLSVAAGLKAIRDF